MTGYKRPLELEDLWELNKHDQTKVIYDSFDKHMKREVAKAKQELEKRRNKRKQKGNSIEMNGLSKAQSQNVLLVSCSFVTPFLQVLLKGVSPPKSVFLAISGACLTVLPPRFLNVLDTPKSENSLP